MSPLDKKKNPSLSDMAVMVPGSPDPKAQELIRRDEADVNRSVRPDQSLIKAKKSEISREVGDYKFYLKFRKRVINPQWINKNLTSILNPEAKVTNQYRELSYKINELIEEVGLKALTITSPIPQEGKTTTLINLALVMAENIKRRICLVDLNFRNPSILTYFGFEVPTGLSDFIRNFKNGHNCTVETIMIQDNLFLLPSGTVQKFPSELINSEELERIIAELKENFDLILIDTPAILATADVNKIKQFVDALFILVKAESTTIANLKQAITKIGRDSITGIIINQVHESIF